MFRQNLLYFERMQTVYLIDYIGVHCGMHYYLEAFKKVLDSVPGFRTEILSNYSDNDKKPFFTNQYHGGTVSKARNLIGNVLRLKKKIINDPDAIYVYLTYGNYIDLMFLNVVKHARNHIIDIHEAIAQHIDNKKYLKDRFKSLYRNKIKRVICHSERTMAFLKDYGYKGHRLDVPHFKYVFPKEWNSANVPDEVKDAIDNEKVNLLFFGNITRNKGIDILIDAYNRLDKQTADRLNVIVAGKDYDGAVNEVAVSDDRSIHFFLRHISDDELMCLYSNADYLALPYRKTSQSGILEMAFYFKKPIIASSVPYFMTTLEEFPSFGMIAGSGAADYAESLKRIAVLTDKSQFFNDSDYARYENRREVEAFKQQFEKLMGEQKSK